MLLASLIGTTYHSRAREQRRCVRRLLLGASNSAAALPTKNTLALCLQMLMPKTNKSLGVILKLSLPQQANPSVNTTGPSTRMHLDSHLSLLPSLPPRPDSLSSGVCINEIASQQVSLALAYSNDSGPRSSSLCRTLQSCLTSCRVETRVLTMPS